MRNSSKLRANARTKTAPSGVNVSARKKRTPGKLRSEIQNLKLRLENAEAILSAIRVGEVDALVVGGPGGEQVLTLKGADQPYRVLVENMNEGALTVTCDGTLLYSNRYFANLAGMPLEKVIGGSFFDLVRPSDRGMLAAILREATAAAGKWEVVLAGSAGEIPVQISATPLNVDGIEAVCMIVTDLRQRQRNEEIVASETLARSILDQAAEAIVVCDTHGRIIRANDSAAMLCGQNPLFCFFSAAFPLQPVDGWQPSSAGADGPILEWCFLGQTRHSVDCELSRGDGHDPVPLLVSAGPLASPAGRIVGCVITLTDISDRMRAEAAQRFLFESSAALSASLDLDTAMPTLAHAVVPALADWCTLDVIEDGDNIRRVVAHRVDGSSHVETAESCVVSGELNEPANALFTRNPALITNLSAGGPNRHYPAAAHSLISVPIRARSRLLGAITMSITLANRQYGASDLALAEELARRAAHTIENARLYADARAAAKAREEFMSVASHELRTPLGVLTLHAQRLIEVAGQEPAHALKTRLQKVVRQTERLTSIVDRLLDDSRISTGQLSLDLHECDLATILKETVERFTDQAARVGSRLLVRIEGAIVGYWDSFRLEQVVSNLLSNAIKYGDGNRIEIVAEAVSLGVRLVVRDFGIGINAEDVQRIFERFHRSEATRQYGGLGLGLYIARQIVQAHCGTIRVQARPKEGSSFIVELPLDPRARKSEAAVPP